MVAIPARRRPDESIIDVLWSNYLRQLRRRPLRTKAVTSAVILGLSDMIAQGLNGKPFAVRRNLAAALWGLCWSGPSAHFWQNFMERISRGRRDIPAVLVKVLFDQLTYGPLNNLITMAFLTLVVEDKGLEHFLHKVVHEYPRIQLNGWKVWPLAAMFNYLFVPLQRRVLFLNCIALGWTTFLNMSATSKNKIK